MPKLQASPQPATQQQLSCHSATYFCPNVSSYLLLQLPRCPIHSSSCTRLKALAPVVAWRVVLCVRLCHE